VKRAPARPKPPEKQQKILASIIFAKKLQYFCIYFVILAYHSAKNRRALAAEKTYIDYKNEQT
jgi:hypothetical protein